ncbi:acyltransferase family protein [bacterium]|nr:acyltransferase family protein [bacterium]
MRRLFWLDPSVYTGDLDPDRLDQFDPTLVESLLPTIRILRHYFRADVQGAENIPDGAAMLVGNHNAGITFLDPFMMMEGWYAQNGAADPVYFMTHDAMIQFPALKNFLIRLGAVRASRRNARTILESGHKFVVYPGGDQEAFRPYSHRWKVEFHDRKGFARLALETHAPIVPVANAGGHETFMVLHSGEAAAKALHLDKMLHAKIFPVSLMFPWGLMIGPMFHMPLPAKTDIRIGAPIDLDEISDPGKPIDERVDEVYTHVTCRLQDMLDDIHRHRKYPVLG